MRIRILAAAAALALLTGLSAPAAAAGTAPTAEGTPGFLPVSEVIVPIASHGRLSGYVVVKGTIEFATPDVAKSAEPWMPRVVDAWLRTVHGLSQRGHFDDSSVDPEMLKRQLLQATKGALKSDTPSDILISQAIFTKAN